MGRTRPIIRETSIKEPTQEEIKRSFDQDQEQFQALKQNHKQALGTYKDIVHSLENTLEKKQAEIHELKKQVNRLSMNKELIQKLNRNKKIIMDHEKTKKKLQEERENQKYRRLSAGLSTKHLTQSKITSKITSPQRKNTPQLSEKDMLTQSRSSVKSTKRKLSKTTRTPANTPRYSAV